MARSYKEIAIDLHNSGLVVIEVGRQALHAPTPTFAQWAERIEREAEELKILAKELKERDGDVP